MRDPLPDRTDDVFLKELLESINTFRARHGAEPLTLDPDLVTEAKSRAQVASTYNMLDENHQGKKPEYGENMSWQASGSDQPASTTGASSSWYAEIVDYDFTAADGYAGRTVGHFTQLAWKGTTKFGAARAFGKGPKYYETYIVGVFSPPGNYSGQYAANVVAPTQGQDNNAVLRWTSFDGTTWSPITLLSDHESLTGPAAAVFNNKLYCAHRGNSDANLRYSKWATDTQIPGCQTADSPALAVYQNQLYCMHRGHTDTGVYVTTFNGGYWTSDTSIPGHATAAGPALAVYRDKLYNVHRSDANTNLWSTTFDGTTWAVDTQIAGCQSATTPALAVYQDKLFCVHRGSQDTGIWVTTCDGATWTAPTRIPDCQTNSGPAVAAYLDKLHCVYRGTDDSLRHITFDGTSWSAPTTITNATSTTNPALAVHHNRLYCVHRK